MDGWMEGARGKIDIGKGGGKLMVDDDCCRMVFTTALLPWMRACFHIATRVYCRWSEGVWNDNVFQSLTARHSLEQ